MIGRARAVLLLLAVVGLPACGRNPVSQPASPVFLMTSPADAAIGVTGTPVFTWSPAPDATSYTLQVSTDSRFSSLLVNLSGLQGSSSSPAVPLAPGTVYFWQVIADTPSGPVTPPGAPFTFTTFAPTPGDFTLTAPADRAVAVSSLPTLTWTSSLGAASYRLQIAIGSGFSALVFDQSDLTTTSTTLTTALPSSTTFFWRVLAVSTNTVTATNAPFSFTTLAAPPPGPFTLLAPTSGAAAVSTLPTFTWSTSAGAVAYTLEVARDPDFTQVVATQTGILTTTATLLTPLEPLMTYYWRVRALNTSGSTVAFPAPFFFTTA